MSQPFASEWRCLPEIEKVLIGAAVLGGFSKVRNLPAEVFGIPAHRRIWQAIQAASAHGDPEMLSVKVELGADMDAVGGVEYLIACAEACPAPKESPRYAGMIEREAVARRAQLQLQAMAEQLQSGGDPSKVLAQSKILEGLIPQPERQVTSIAELSLPGPVEGVTTGFPLIDQMSGRGAGFVKGQLSVVEAYHKGGKTAFSTQATVAAAKVGGRQGFHVMYATFGDLTPERLLARMFVQEAGRWEARTTDDYAALNELQGLPIEFFNGPKFGKDVEGFALMVKRLMEKMPLGLVICDYAQRMRCNSAKTPYERIEGVAEGLDDLAQETGLPIVALSQVSGQVKGGSTSDIIAKGGRGLEEHAGLVLRLMTHEEENEDGVIETSRTIEVPFNRFGPSGGFVNVWFDDERVRFNESANQEPRRRPRPQRKAR